MSQIEDFKKKAIQDPSVRAELSTLAGRPRGELIAGVSGIAARHGYTLTESEIAAAVDRQVEHATARDLNEEELAKVAAGSCQDELPGFGYPPDTFIE